MWLPVPVKGLSRAGVVNSVKRAHTNFVKTQFLGFQLMVLAHGTHFLRHCVANSHPDWPTVTLKS